MLKIIVIEQELGRRAQLVQQRAWAIEAKGEFGDWLGELNGIMKQLNAARTTVLGIDDSTPSPQALAQILKLLEHVRALDARIAAIGKAIT